jgi:ketosteroid isomerase-like protein
MGMPALNALRIAAAVSLTGLGSCLSPSAATSRPVAPHTPESVAQSLLQADRAWSAASGHLRFRDALSAMFSDGVMMPARDGILMGRAAVLGAFATSPDTAATLAWTPVKVGLSADGQHGFTVGFLHMTQPNGSRTTAKYLAYWIRENAMWKVAAWRRRPMSAAVTDSALLSPVLPSRLVAPVRDEALIASHRRALMAAEQGFSDEASRIGVGAAFALLGDSSAVNAGAPTDAHFIVGPQAIARAVAGGQPLNAPSTIVWSADTALVASSGDLGITFGVIRPKQPVAGASGGVAFFTIWRKSSPNAPWRYVAE